MGRVVRKEYVAQLPSIMSHEPGFGIGRGLPIGGFSLGPPGASTPCGHLAILGYLHAWKSGLGQRVCIDWIL